MLINQNTEYVLGTPTKWELRKLTGRRSDYSFVSSTLRSLMGVVPGLILLLFGVAYGVVSFIIVSVVFAIVGSFAAVFFWAEAPASRRLFADDLRNQGRIISDSDILFRLVMTDQVKAALRRQWYWGWGDGVKERVDSFIEFLAPHWERCMPEQSDFLTREWEQKHGKLYDHPKLLAIDGAGALRAHVRCVLFELRSKRAAQLQQKLTADSKRREQSLQDLEYQHAQMLVRQ